MSLAIFYNGSDSQTIQDSYQAARSSLAQADRQNIDACWDAGLSTWNTTAARAYNPATNQWSVACYSNVGSVLTLDTGLCDQDTRVIVINGNWARNVAAYGAVQGSVITTAGFVGLMHRMADADPNLARRNYIHTIADDIAATAREPYP